MQNIAACDARRRPLLHRIPCCVVFIALFGLWLITPRTASADDLAAELGLVKEKPSSGRYVETDRGFMVPFKVTIPGREVSFEMVPVPGGTFKMGSPPDEEGRKEDEGPQFTVQVEPFWIGKHEVTWAEYYVYMDLYDIFKEFDRRKLRRVTEDRKIDAVTAPSSLYEPEITFSAGSAPDQPAATMSQFAARQYTKWLSAITSDFYRLPSEAEWEYACRAGTTTAYSFGDDPALLGEYAWFKDNSARRRQTAGQKKPNPWGLYDMHGNVAEWVLDEHSEDGYERFDGKTVKSAEALFWPTREFPLVVRGGSFELSAAECRSAARLGSNDDEWRDEDPNFPQSPWWVTTSPGTGVGMRIIRPLNPPATRAAREEYWKSSTKNVQLDAEYRIREEGRGAIGIADKELPAAIKNLKSGK